MVLAVHQVLPVPREIKVILVSQVLPVPPDTLVILAKLARPDLRVHKALLVVLLALKEKQAQLV